MSIDKRRCHRFQLELPVCFHPASHPADLAEATTLNISAMGICMATREPLISGEEILIYLQLPSCEDVQVLTRVIWTRENSHDPVHAFRVGLKIIEPFRFDEAKFVKFFATQMVNFFKEHPHPPAI